jgi:hypothetical protein
MPACANRIGFIDADKIPKLNGIFSNHQPILFCCPAGKVLDVDCIFFLSKVFYEGKAGARINAS